MEEGKGNRKQGARTLEKCLRRLGRMTTSAALALILTRSLWVMSRLSASIPLLGNGAGKIG